jgi:hypothetical protein
MGMPIDTNPAPRQLAFVTVQLASLGLTSKHKRKAVFDNREEWDVYFCRKRDTTETKRGIQ